MPRDGRAFRRAVGFTNAEKIKKFYKAKDYTGVNWERVEFCNQRIKDMFSSINNAVHPSIRLDDLNSFNRKIDESYHILRDNNIIPRFNNYGRLPEDVYYNWMRGYAVIEFFSGGVADVFGVPRGSIRPVGHDQLRNIDTFSKSPAADLEITLNENIVRLEIQSGFTGVNDIKAHKVREARHIFNTQNILSYIVHFDLFNGCAAIVDISNIDDNNINWAHRQQFEDQIVFSIPDEAFKWCLSDELPKYTDIIS